MFVHGYDLYKTMSKLRGWWRFVRRIKDTHAEVSKAEYVDNTIKTNQLKQQILFQMSYNSTRL